MMKEKLVLATIAMAVWMPALAGGDSTLPLPEPSTLGLFAAAAIAIVLISKFKK